MTQSLRNTSAWGHGSGPSRDPFVLGEFIRGFAQDIFKQLMAIRQMFNLQESGPPGGQVL